MRYLKYFESIDHQFRKTTHDEYYSYETEHTQDNFTTREKLIIKNFLSAFNPRRIYVEYTSPFILYIFNQLHSMDINIHISKFEDDWYNVRVVSYDTGASAGKTYAYYICDGHEGLVKCIDTII